MTSIIWFRLDLRLADNPALNAAIARGGAVVPAFIWAPEEEAPWEPGAASRWWLHQSLASLRAAIGKIGGKLLLRRGPSLDALRELAKQTGADAVFWNRRYEPAIVKRDNLVHEALTANGLIAESFNAALLHEPWTVQNQSGKPFQVFTPFWKHCLRKPAPPKPLPPPPRWPAPARWPKSIPLEALELQPKLNWADGFGKVWQPGEPGALANLHRFADQAMSNYDVDRDRPDLPGTSRLSPHLHFGEISPRQIWQATGSQTRFLAEIGWREFAHHLLHHFPHAPSQPLRPNFAQFPWRDDPTRLQAWQRGKTGYPIVDSGLRQLWQVGWMHNRVRMIVGSFLVKDLLLSWTEGARWFWDTLVDADLAQNTLGWQWIAGCGADAAPYFRVFNPVSQGEKFDPNGDYVRQYCPELSQLPHKWIHQPWSAPEKDLAAAAIKLGRDYPRPIISHTIAREAALEAFQKVKSRQRTS